MNIYITHVHNMYTYRYNSLDNMFINMQNCTFYCMHEHVNLSILGLFQTYFGKWYAGVEEKYVCYYNI